METKSLSLAEALPIEQERIRNLIKRYKDPALKGAGDLGAAMMQADLEKSEVATKNQDTVAMIRCYNELKTYED